MVKTLLFINTYMKRRLWIMGTDLKLLQTKVDTTLYNIFKDVVVRYKGKTIRWMLEDWMKLEIFKIKSKFGNDLLVKELLDEL